MWRSLGMVFFTLFLCRIDGEEISKQYLNIGVILNADDDISRKVISIAIQNANVELDKFNYVFQVITETLEETNSFYVIRKACNLLQNGLVAIISPISEVPSRHISSLCSKFHIPHLVSSCRFPESLENYPMDIKMSPNCDQYAKIIYHFITEVENWGDMVLIHSSDNCILKFEHLLNQFESRFRMRQWAHHDLKKNKELLWDISKDKNYRYFLVDIPYWQITDFLIMASVHNMTDPQFSFIFTDWDASLVDIAAFKINNNVNISAFSIIDHVKINQAKKDNKNLDTLVQTIIKSEKTMRKADIATRFMSKPAILFDSISLLTKSLINLMKTRPLSMKSMKCSSNYTWPLGPSLWNAITSTEMPDGITGKIIFSENAQRKTYNLSIMGLTENGFEESGFWLEDKLTLVNKKVEPFSGEIEKVKQPLRVTTIVNTPFVLYRDGIPDPTNYDTSIDAWNGFCIDLLKELSGDLGLNFSIHLVKDNKFGTVVPNETNPDGTQKWNGMIGELISKEADLVVGPMTISYEREKVVDFTTPFMSLGLSIMFLSPKKEAPGLFSFLSPLSLPVWLYVISAYLGVSFIIFIIAHVTPYEWMENHPCDDNSDKSNQFNLLNSLWFAVGALVRQGLEFCPQASSTRMVSGAWWFFTLIIISTYTANLAAFLTVEQVILPIKSVEDLANQTNIKYGRLRGGTSEDFFEKALIPTYQKMAKFMKKNPDVLVDSIVDGVDKVRKSKGKYAFLLESAMNDYHIQRDCSLIRVGDLLDSKGYGIGFPTGSVLRAQMTESILKLQKSQIIARLYHKWWYEFNVSNPCDVKESPMDPSSLKVQQIGGMFLLLGAGLVCAGFVSIVEVYNDYRHKRSQWKMSFGKFLKNELQFAMRFMSSSKKKNTPGVPMNKCLERINLFDQQPAQPKDTSVMTTHLLDRSVEQLDVSPNTLDQRPLYVGIDSPFINGSKYFGRSNDTLASISNSKYLWGLNNNL